MKKVDIEIAKHLQFLRKMNGYKQSDVAKNLGISISGVSEIENAKRSITLRELIVLSEMYHLSIDDMIKGILYTDLDKKVLLSLQLLDEDDLEEIMYLIDFKIRKKKSKKNME